MADLIHCKTFRVRTVDLDLTGRIQPIALLDYLLESAGEHAAALGVGVTDLIGTGRTWVLSRLHASFLRYPQYGEEVEIRTWPSGTSAFRVEGFRGERP